MPTPPKSPARVALVTGGARRIGRAIVKHLAEGGFDIAFTYLNSDLDAKKLIDLLTRKKHRALAIKVDLTQADAARTIAEQFHSTFKRLDVLVNNASLYERSSLHSVDADQLARLWTIHVWNPLALCREFEPMLRKHRGHVVNMVDLLAEKPWPEYLGYCTSKAGLANLTLGLARELSPEVTVNGIAPGVVEWPEDFPKAAREKYLKRVPLGRAGTPKDVADLVHFLCTTGRYVTGQIIRLDGGRSIT